ncbi:MAG: glycoside hydrolase family 3 C-terminal domain-containing protein [Spirochaetales bacterium]|nr:glycoside hydrolase family 3 C-terminal domain-containing protein [Spirochaetales bacterium]
MNRSEAREKARELVARMTVREAASQLIFNAPAIESLGVPEYNWWNETLHGVARAGTATVFPQAIAMAATFDEDLVYKEAEVCATEGRAKYNAASKNGDRDIYKGLTFWSPNINIFRDPRWGRGHETLGEDPYLTSKLGVQFVKGLQGDGPVMKAAACAKHFAVHSGPESLRHSFNAKASEKDMAETYLPAFKALVDAKVEAVMGAYNRTNDEPCCASDVLIKKTLRGKWGFEGHYVSDCWAVRDFHEHHKVTSCPEESVALALNAGCDLNCGCTYQFVMNAYELGLISEKTIRESAIRLFTTRYLLGIMGESEFDSIPITVVESPQHLAVAECAARESCVLLKNNGTLPLCPDQIRTLAVIGPNADSRIALKGNYYGTSSRHITVLQGIQNYLEGKAQVLYSQGCDICKDRVENLAQSDDRISEAVAMAKASDAVVLVVGLDETLEGEEGDEGNSYKSGDKEDLLLPACQRRLVDKVLEVGRPTVIVLLAGSSVDLGAAGEKADALLLGWYPGVMGGKAIADILFGKVSPSGKLPVTFYHQSDLDLMPDFTDYSMKGRTYRYFTHRPLYPFGYGLTYSRVEVNSAECRSIEGGFVVKVSAKNTGRVDTDDVIQVYAQNRGSRNAPENPRLVGFKRISVGSSKKVEAEILISDEDLLVVDQNGEKVKEGSVVLYVGTCQPDDYSCKLSGAEIIQIEVG